MTFGTISSCPLFCLQSREGEPSFFALALAPGRTGLSEMQGLEEGKNEGHTGGVLWAAAEPDGFLSYLELGYWGECASVRAPSLQTLALVISCCRE